jgi:hypothetical protein
VLLGKYDATWIFCGLLAEFGGGFQL